MLSEHIQHGDIWKSAKDVTVYIIGIPGTDDFHIVSDEHRERISGKTKLKESQFNPNAKGAELKWRAPKVNNNNFDMTGDDARVLSTAIMILSREQNVRNQGILDGLQAISQAQPPITTPPTQG